MVIRILDHKGRASSEPKVKSVENKLSLQLSNLGDYNNVLFIFGCFVIYSSSIDLLIYQSPVNQVLNL